MTPDNIPEDDIPEDDAFDIDEGFDDDWEDDVVDPQDSLPPTGAIPAQAAKKTVLQKFFLPIVIGVVSLFALLFVLGQSFVSKPSAVTAPMDTDINLVDSSTTDTASTETNSIETPYGSAESVPADSDIIPIPDLDGTAALQPNAPMQQAEEAAPLMPLPGEEADAAETFELADLEAELQNDNETESLDLNEMFDGAPPKPTENAPTEELVTPLAPKDAADALIVPNSPEIVDNVDDVPALESSTDLSIEEIPAAVPNDILAEEGDSEDPMKNELDVDIEGLKKEKAALQAEIAKSQETLSALNAEIGALKENISEAKAIHVKDAAPTKEVTTPKEKPAVEPKTQAPTTKPTQWVLKSAQPGKATIAVAGSNDLRNIEIGQTIPNLGRVESIQMENGLWVVRATQGTISQ